MLVSGRPRPVDPVGRSVGRSTDFALSLHVYLAVQDRRGDSVRQSRMTARQPDRPTDRPTDCDRPTDRTNAFVQYGIRHAVDCAISLDGVDLTADAVSRDRPRSFGAENGMRRIERRRTCSLAKIAGLCNRDRRTASDAFCTVTLTVELVDCIQHHQGAILRKRLNLTMDAQLRAREFHFLTFLIFSFVSSSYGFLSSSADSIPSFLCLFLIS